MNLNGASDLKMLSILKIPGFILLFPFIFISIALSSIDDLTKLLIWPTLSIAFIYVLFILILSNQVKTNILSEIGFIHFSFLIIYTLFPSLILIFGALDEGSPLAWINPDTEDMANHLWRHVLFALGFAISFILTRGKHSIKTSAPKRNLKYDNKIIFVSILFLLLSSFAMIILAAPITDYYSNYTKFDHLPSLVRSLVSLAVRFNWGFTTILVVFLFMNYHRYKILIPFVIVPLMALDLYITAGARIQSFVMLASILCIYGIFIKQIQIFRFFVYAFLALLAFIFLGIIRLSTGEVDIDFASTLLTLGGEFGAVFYTGFVLYSDRAADSLPFVPNQMFFYDLWALMPFIDISSWTPMNWFHQNYHPEAPVPPFTLGPIANSAIWGGEIDLIIRGIFSGIFFSTLTRVFNANRNNWMIVLIYVFSFSTTILIMKYSIFYHFQLILKTLLPVIFICWAISKISFINTKFLIPKHD
ncbi:oligosaccharide repeat unit polymerase [Gammaproteobacteria bacterium]|nr:oligosaccharide repeat unit polymerase [Gammaproteobacteria bacterium]